MLEGFTRTFTLNSYTELYHPKCLLKIVTGGGFKNINDKCAGCSRLETNEHIFFLCNYAKKIWNFVYPTIHAILHTLPFKIFHLALNKYDYIPQNKQKWSSL